MKLILGETNDPDEFAEMMTEDIMDAYIKVEKIRKDKKNKK